METKIFAVRTAANREDQVVDYLISKLERETQLEIYSIIKAHGMRGYIFIEVGSQTDAELAIQRVPYARGILPQEIPYQEIEHMLEQVKVEMNIRKSDIVEIISGPFKRENAKVIRINKVKEEIVVELLQAAVPIPITVSMDSVKVIRREEDRDDGSEEELKL
jgi:transcription termination/antitermination protein NusG